MDGDKMDQELIKNVQKTKENLEMILLNHNQYLSYYQKPIKWYHYLIYPGLSIGSVVLFTYFFAKYTGANRQITLYVLFSQAMLIVFLYLFVYQKMKPESFENRKPIKQLDEEKFILFQKLFHSKVPPEYWSVTALSFFEKNIKTGRCHTIQECIDLFQKNRELYQKHLKEVEQFKSIQETNYC
jgi:hypothetical protein